MNYYKLDIKTIGHSPIDYCNYFSIDDSGKYPQITSAFGIDDSTGETIVVHPSKYGIIYLFQDGWEEITQQDYLKIMGVP
jgi:hypothetical protein